MTKIQLTVFFILLSFISFSQTKKTNPKKSTQSAVKKTFITMCGDRYEKGTNFESMLPNDWETRVDMYVSRSYKSPEVNDLVVIGANSNGILIKATGQITGTEHTVIYSCDGTLY